MGNWRSVDDLGNACVYVLEKWDLFEVNSPKDLHGNPLSFLNVGTGSDISIRQLANLIANFVKYDGEIKWDKSRPDGTPKKQLDVSRINAMGWHSQISLEKGLEKTIDIFKKENYSEY